jgi:hypothetical protein
MAFRGMRGFKMMFCNEGPSLKVHRGRCFSSMTKPHDSGGSRSRSRSRTISFSNISRRKMNNSCRTAACDTLQQNARFHETLAVMYLQRGPPIAENKPTTHRSHKTYRTHVRTVAKAWRHPFEKFGGTVGLDGIGFGS